MTILNYDVDEALDKWGIGSHIVVLKSLSDNLSALPNIPVKGENNKKYRYTLRAEETPRSPLNGDLAYDIYRDPAIAEVTIIAYTDSEALTN